MISIYEAFEKFRSRLELSDPEQADASKKHIEMRDYLRSKFSLENDLLTGSYARDTKTKPLKDVDIFCILKKEEKGYRWEHPLKVLEDFKNALSEKYGADNVKLRRRSVQVSFGSPELVNGVTPDVILSFDIVPAYALNSDYEIPDSELGEWIKTNPFTHQAKATEANKSYSNRWKSLVKMIKKWNQYNNKPIEPSFLLEVMALEIIVPPAPPAINYPYELKAFFATAAERIGETWDDPAGLGPPVSDQMNSVKISQAMLALREAEKAASKAIRLDQSGNTGAALDEWQKLFGPRFSKS